MRSVDGGDLGGMAAARPPAAPWFEVTGMLKIFLSCCKDFSSADNGFEVFIVPFDEL